MKTRTRLVILTVVCFLPAYAVYAPIPEQEQGKALSFRLGASFSHDSNIFGAATGAISSMVYNVSPGVSFNSSVTEQTFLSLSYDLSIDHIVDRPGSKDLPSHTLMARIAHQFSQSTNIDLTDGYMISRNPQSLLNGIPLNTDQSFKRNEFDGRYSTNLGAKTDLVVKYRNIDISYDNPLLGASLNHMEQLAGVEANFAYLPETKLAGEYRYQDITYGTDGANKNKRSNFLLAGADYSPGEQLVTTARFGAEFRSRESERSATAPYAELSARYTYNPGSFLSAGYNYTYEEPSDLVRFTDEKVNRFFVNLQHRLSALFTASGSIDYEPSVLQGRRTFANLNETTTRFGLGLSWLPDKNWTVSGTYDLDKVNSDDPSRDQNRNRYGVSARISF
ncbi:MAG: hypothetical protein ACHQ5A_06755 [Opitutales bacterium]